MHSCTSTHASQLSGRHRQFAACRCRASSSTTIQHGYETIQPGGVANRRAALGAVLGAAPAMLLGARARADDAFLDTAPASAPPDASVTDRVYLDIGLCPESFKSNRTLGDKSILCSNPEPLGRLTLELYGKAAPGTVAQFKALVASGTLNGTCFSKIIPGQWLMAGQQGPKRSGLLAAPPNLPPNPDTLSPSAFKLRHSWPGTLSLNLSENEDEPYIRDARGYRNLSFLITTGPGLAVGLDGENIVFGAVTEGMDVVARIAEVPVFLPDSNLRAFNELASFIGDDRAGTSRAKWNRPLKAVVITDSGAL